MLGAGGLAGSCFVTAAAGSAIIVQALAKTFQPATKQSMAGATPEVRMAYAGRGLAAVELQNLGSMVGSMIAVVLSVPVLLIGALFPEAVKAALGTVSGWLQLPLMIVFLAITWVQAKKWFFTLVTMVLAGGLGFYAMGREELMGNPASLAPLLTGIFVIPVTLMVLGHQGKLERLPKQTPEEITPSDEANTIAPLGGILTAIVAGVGASSAVSVFAERFDEEDYLYMQASAEGANNTLALLLLVLIGAGHSSSAVAVQEMTGSTQVDLFAGFLLVCATGLGMGFGRELVKVITPTYVSTIGRINPKLIACFVLIVSVLTVWYETGATGLLVMASAGALGYAAKMSFVPNQALLMILTGPVLVQKLGLARELAIALGIGF